MNFLEWHNIPMYQGSDLLLSMKMEDLGEFQTSMAKFIEENQASWKIVAEMMLKEYMMGILKDSAMLEQGIQPPKRDKKAIDEMLRFLNGEKP